MKKPVFTGAGVAIITPMHADGSVNYAELGRIIDDQIEHGIDAIIICGTTGESATLTHEEHVECIRFAVEHTARRVPVVAGTGSNDTAYAVKLSQHAEEVGADALLLVTPYYNKASQAGLIAHFSAIANAVSLPCILYNVPSRLQHPARNAGRAVQAAQHKWRQGSQRQPGPGRRDRRAVRG